MEVVTLPGRGRPPMPRGSESSPNRHRTSAASAWGGERSLVWAPEADVSDLSGEQTWSLSRRVASRLCREIPGMGLGATLLDG